jgi:hypothetical protein
VIFKLTFDQSGTMLVGRTVWADFRGADFNKGNRLAVGDVDGDGMGEEILVGHQHDHNIVIFHYDPSDKRIKRLDTIPADSAKFNPQDELAVEHSLREREGATFKVNTADDTNDADFATNCFDGKCDDGTGHCSLRAAIQECNAGSGRHIIVDPLPGNPPYFLKQSLGQLNITTNLTLAGNLPDRTVIDGQNKTRVLKISNPGGSGIVQISNVIIQHGKSDSEGTGAGIRIGKGSSLSLQKSDVRQNRDGVGGVGITNFGYLQLIGCTVDDNFTSRAGNGSVYEDSGGITNEESGEADIIGSTISNNCGVRGGGIENLGLLRIFGSTFTGNHAVQGGAIINHTVPATAGNGSIDNRAHLSIDNSTIAGNFAASGADVDNVNNLKVCGVTRNVDSWDWNGGAISNGAPIHRDTSVIRTFGEMHIRNSTISGNLALRGGGIENGDDGYAEISNSTISGNKATRAGGIYNTGPGTASPNLGLVDISFSTITNNIAIGLDTRFLKVTEPKGGGGGISNEALVRMGSTILAGNETPRGPDSPDGFSRTDHSNGRFLSQRHNVVGVVNENFNLEDPDFGRDLRFDRFGPVGNPPKPLDPRLGVLLSTNGGPTATHELMDTSPAINFSNLPSGSVLDFLHCPTTDQRGVSRPQGMACDAGAFERRPPPSPP